MIAALAAVTLGLVGLSAQSAITLRQVTPRYPSTSQSDAFRLVINLTDPSRDFSPSVQNTYVASIHVGAGLALVGNVDSTPNARIFYQNGTAEQRRDGHSTVITDSGTPPFPSGLRLTKDGPDAKVSTAHLDAGQGTPGIRLSNFPEPYVFLNPETWLACNQSLAYYQGQYFIILKQAQTSVGQDGYANPNIPQNCVPVRLVPECTQLNSLPPGSYSSHEFAVNDRCYDDVSSIDWSEYGP
ncbi:hypothetical protein CDD82_1208 [Ophiocordyceps australis]|uniref:DUF7907 domain-containing protein n=1 Tax=Ophiocordyceps australis TaxID=1399860 RepID=A0A2C5ZPJ1_9HYPO|nr:hypothetical protein CDD82_1208 [Ophiocordyceps australis]